jgi:predicted dehydrogenase
MATHVPLVQMTLSRGIPTIVRKPFGRDMAEVRQMTEAAAEAGVFLAVHENFRFQAPLMRIKEIIDSGAIGPLNWGRVSFRTGWDIYAGQPYLRKEERFVLLDVGVHVLDVARYYFGEVQRLSAELQRRNPTVTGEDTATMLCRHRSGVVSVVECTYETRKLPDPFPELMLEIEGDNGSIVLKPNYVIDLTSNGVRTVIDAEIEPLPWAERPWHVVQDSVRNTCRHMVDSIRAGRPASTSAADNLKTFALVEAAYEAGKRAT